MATRKPLVIVSGQVQELPVGDVPAGAEPSVTAGTNAQFWRGDKSWRDFATDVRAAVLTGLSTATNSAIAATDTVLAALGKLQAQLNNAVFLTGNQTVGGNKSFSGNLLAIGGLLGYGIGAGGTAIQPTSNTTAVVLNKPNGTITLADGIISGNGIIAFAIQNSLITDKSIVVVHGVFDGSSAAIAQFVPQVAFTQGGFANIQIKNNNPIDVGTGSVKIKFAVFEGSTS